MPMILLRPMKSKGQELQNKKTIKLVTPPLMSFITIKAHKSLLKATKKPINRSPLQAFQRKKKRRIQTSSAILALEIQKLRKRETSIEIPQQPPIQGDKSPLGGHSPPRSFTFSFNKSGLDMALQPVYSAFC